MIKINNLSLLAGSFKLNCTLNIDKSEYLIILGQSGSGKTILLETLCGLRPVESGSIVVNNRNITYLDPKQRRIGYVPQEYALFDHLNVEKNLNFGLKKSTIPKHQKSDVIFDIAKNLSIDTLLKRKIANLSGGERQRVALGRALAFKPSLLLLDEPVSALDEYMRESVCTLLQKIHQNYSVPVIHVCHSVEEASIAGSKIAIMRNGAIEQCDSLENIQGNPKSEYVARLLRLDNIFDACSDSGNSYFTCKYNFFQGSQLPKGAFKFLIHPWNIRVSNDVHDYNRFDTIIRDIRFSGSVVKIFTTGALPVTVHLSRREFSTVNLTKGSQCCFCFLPEAVKFFK